MTKIASFFTGAGGIDIAFEQEGFQITYANEVDPYPAQIYDLNHEIKTTLKSIEDVKPQEVPKSDIYIAGFPCTDISIAGYRQGLWDDEGNYTRSGLYFELLRIIKANKPPIIFLENVKNLVGHNNGETFNIIKESLTNLGYFVKYKVLNGMEYGNIPQNRERIYILAFLDKNQYNLFEFPQKIPLTTKLFDVIDFFGDVDEKYYYTEGKYKGNIFDELSKAMEEESIDCPSVYQWRRIYVRKNQSGVVPCICCNSGAGGHNLPLIKDSKGRIRKLTPKECFNVQGYPKDYKYPNLSDARLYKAAGNSVVVPVVARIAHNLKNII